MSKYLIVIILLFVSTICFSQEKFNDTEIKVVEQSQYPNAILYQDSSGNSYLTVTMLLTEQGILIGEKGSPFENWILFPTDCKQFTEQDLKDIFVFIKSRDLKNRIK